MLSQKPITCAFGRFSFIRWHGAGDRSISFFAFASLFRPHSTSFLPSAFGRSFAVSRENKLLTLLLLLPLNNLFFLVRADEFPHAYLEGKRTDKKVLMMCFLRKRRKASNTFFCSNAGPIKGAEPRHEGDGGSKYFLPALIPLCFSTHFYTAQKGGRRIENKNFFGPPSAARPQPQQRSQVPSRHDGLGWKSGCMGRWWW